MLAMAVINALEPWSANQLHAVFPPLEHALLDLSMVTVAAAYLHYVLDDRARALRYLRCAARRGAGHRADLPGQLLVVGGLHPGQSKLQIRQGLV